MNKTIKANDKTIQCPRCHSGIEYNDDEEACVDCEYEFQKEDFNFDK